MSIPKNLKEKYQEVMSWKPQHLRGVRLKKSAAAVLSLIKSIAVTDINGNLLDRSL